jgi:hypothetical protein
MARLALFLIALITGAAAVIAGALLAGEPESGGPLEFPAEWLEGSPFADYFIPGAVLGLLGLTMLGAAYSQLTRLSHAPHLALFCGVALDIWILVQVAIVPFSIMQPLILAAGSLMAVLAIHQLTRRDAISAKPSKATAAR